MDLPSFAQFLSHYLRKRIQHCPHIYLVQRAAGLNLTPDFVRIDLTIVSNTRMESFFFGWSGDTGFSYQSNNIAIAFLLYKYF